MKIQIICNNEPQCDAFPDNRMKKFSVIHDTFNQEFLEHPKTVARGKIAAVVTPGNSYGIMDGGFDLSVRKTFGKLLEQQVQHKIVESFGGFLPPSMPIYLNTAEPLCPFMVYMPAITHPHKKATCPVYECVWMTLLLAAQFVKEDEILLLPAFGSGSTLLKPQEVAIPMMQAIDNFYNPKKCLKWDDLKGRV